MTQAYLRCDAPDCDHSEFHDAIDRSLVDKPCPVCGANLLTEKDFRVFRRMARVIRVLKFLGLAKDYDPSTTPPPGYQNVSVHHHDGKTTVTTDPK